MVFGSVYIQALASIDLPRVFNDPVYHVCYFAGQQRIIGSSQKHLDRAE